MEILETPIITAAVLQQILTDYSLAEDAAALALVVAANPDKFVFYVGDSFEPIPVVEFFEIPNKHIPLSIHCIEPINPE